MLCFIKRSVKPIGHEVDVDKASDLASEMKIRNIPTLLLMKDGKIIDRIVGVISESDVKNRINEYL